MFNCSSQWAYAVFCLHLVWFQNIWIKMTMAKVFSLRLQTETWLMSNTVVPLSMFYRLYSSWLNIYILALLRLHVGVLAHSFKDPLLLLYTLKLAQSETLQNSKKEPENILNVVTGNNIATLEVLKWSINRKHNCYLTLIRWCWSLKLIKTGVKWMNNGWR